MQIIIILKFFYILYKNFLTYIKYVKYILYDTYKWLWKWSLRLV